MAWLRIVFLLGILFGFYLLLLFGADLPEVSDASRAVREHLRYTASVMSAASGGGSRPERLEQWLETSKELEKTKIISIEMKRYPLAPFRMRQVLIARVTTYPPDGKIETHYFQLVGESDGYERFSVRNADAWMWKISVS